MTHNRGKKPSKFKKTLDKTLAIIQSIKTLQDKGGLHIDRSKREICLIREIFWDKKNEIWRNNFAYNLSVFMDVMEEKPKMLPIQIFAIDLDNKAKGPYLTTFFPDRRACMPTQ